jgi:hypothetical protein
MRPLEDKQSTSSLLIVMVDELKYHNDELIQEMVDMFEKVLFPTDFSKYSQKVLECVRELPGVNEVVLLHVIGPADPLARV